MHHWWGVTTGDLFIDVAMMIGAAMLMASLLTLYDRWASAFFYFLTALFLAFLALLGIGIDCLLLGILLSTFALFWYLTQRRGWPALIRKEWWSVRRAMLLAGSMVVIILTCSVVLDLFSFPFATYDCIASAPPTIHETSNAQTVFVAKVIITVPGLAAGIVKYHYWGLPPWNTKIVLLKGSLDRRTYFIESPDAGGFLTRFIPVVEATCGRTNLIENAGADLRLLHDGPPKNSARIIERVVTRTNAAPYVRGVPGVRVEVSGETRAFTAVTDDQGIYDVTVPPGWYTIALPQSELHSLAHRNQSCGTKQHELREGDAWGCLLVVE